MLITNSFPLTQVKELIASEYPWFRELPGSEGRCETNGGTEEPCSQPVAEKQLPPSLDEGDHELRRTLDVDRRTVHRPEST